MSVRSSIRAMPTMLRIGFAEALAYRAEMIVWILSTTMPLVMLALWSAVAHDQPIGRFGAKRFTAYFLSMFIVRQLTGSWMSWYINLEVRSGSLALRMLRPVHPLLSYAMASLAELPVRSLLAIPLAAVLLGVFARGEITSDPAMWTIWVLAVAGGWAITLMVNFAIGCLALFIESSAKVMDAWVALFFVFSGYMVPVELFPPWLRGVIDWLPFRYQLGLPVEIMTGMHDRASALGLLGRQWLMFFVLTGIVAVIWRRGVRRFAAYGG
jgi:ABC-2 type transport system permease protein